MQIGDRVRVKEGQGVPGMGTVGRISHISKSRYATYLGIRWEDEDCLPPDASAGWDSDRFEIIPEDLECATVGEGLLLEKAAEVVGDKARAIGEAFARKMDGISGIDEASIEFGLMFSGEGGFKGIVTAGGEGDVRITMNWKRR